MAEKNDISSSHAKALAEPGEGVEVEVKKVEQKSFGRGLWAACLKAKDDVVAQVQPEALRSTLSKVKDGVLAEFEPEALKKTIKNRLFI